jgi:hypothetical protein
MTNRTRRLYISVTNDLRRRVYDEHKHRLMPGFTSKWSDLRRDLIDRVEASPDQSLRGDPSPTPPQLHPASSDCVKTRERRL